MAISIDAYASATANGGTTVTVPNLHCTQPKDIIVVYSVVGFGAGEPDISTVQNGLNTLTFTQRSSGLAFAPDAKLECWWAYGPSTDVFTDDIVVTYAGALPQNAVVIVVCVNGALWSDPWDLDGSLPAYAAVNCAVDVSALSTSDCLVLQFLSRFLDSGCNVWYGVPPGNLVVTGANESAGSNPLGAVLLAGQVSPGPFGPISYGSWNDPSFFGGLCYETFNILADVMVADPSIPPGPGPGTGPYGQMYLPMPSAWQDAIGSTVLETSTYAEIWSGMQLGVDGFNNQLLIGGLKVTGGSVTIDRANSIRRSASNVTMLPDPAGELLPIVNLQPTSDTGLFAPYGAEMRLFKGIIAPGTTPASLSSLFPPTWNGPSFPMPPYICAGGVNDTFYFTGSGGLGVPELFTVAPGTYASWADIVTAIMAATGSVSAEPFSTYVTVTSNGIALTFTMADGSGSAGNANTLTTGPTDALSGFGLFSPAVFAGGADTQNVYASLGIFLIEDVDVVNDANGVTLVGTLKDRAQWVARRTFLAPYSTDGVSTTDKVITDILLAVAGMSSILPFLISFTPTFNVPPVTTYNVGDDPWQAVSNLAAACGYEIFFNYDGVCVFCPIPDPAAQSSCITYTEGTSSGPTTIKRVISNSAIPNVICVISQGSGVPAPVQVFWWESDPTSPAFYAAVPSGNFTVPVTTLPPPDPTSIYPTNMRVVTTTVIGAGTQLQQAQDTANAAGALAVGSLENTSITIRFNAAEDVDDIVTLGRVVAGIPTSTDYVVDHAQIDLGVVTGDQVTARPVQ